MSTAAYILREIWIARCRARFDGVEMQARTICLRIISKVQLHAQISRPRCRSTAIQQNSLDILGISRKNIPQKAGIWCRWERPPEGWLKLNVDGSSSAYSTSGGGIIRNHLRVIVAAFSNYYGLGTNNSAEFEALYDGVCLCQKLNATHVLIESDSLIVVTSLQQRYMSHWALEYVYRRCLATMGREYQISHVFRQKNIVADRLADYAHSHKSRREWFSPRELPILIQRAYVLDLHGLWNLRK